MAAAFDLTSNPFHLLSLSVRARREQVVEAHEEALADGRADEPALARAQQAVLTPRTRTQTELSWLPGVPPAEAKKIVEGLAANRIAEADEALGRLRGLDRANLAGDLCARAPGEARYVTALLDAYSAFRSTDALEMLNSLRSVSGFPMPDETQVESGLSALRSLHAKAAVACITAAEAPGEALTPIVESFRAGDEHAGQLLSLIIREYDAWSEPYLARIRERIEADIAACRDGGGPVPVDALTKYLADWDAVSQPVQLLDEAKGHEEPRSKSVYEIVRDFCLWLANDNNRYAEAAKIARALLKTFPELPAVAEQLNKDITTLLRLDFQQGMEVLQPLLVEHLAALKSVPEFIKDLVSSGFGPKSRGRAKRLYLAFTLVAGRTAGTPNADWPWRHMHTTALMLSKKHNARAAASAILEGLAAHKGAPIPEELAGTLERDRRVYRSVLNFDELQRSKTSFRRKMLLISELLEDDDTKQRALLRGLKISLQMKRKERRKKRIFWGVVTSAVIIATPLVIYGLPEVPLSYGSSPTEEFPAEKPPVGTDRLLSREQVRYCVFRGKQLEMMRELASGEQQIASFNADVSDFNSRCGSFRYRPHDMKAVEAELPGREDWLRQVVEHELLIESTYTPPSRRSSSLPEPPSAAPAPQPATPLLDLTDRANAKRVQAALRSIGDYTGAVDGLWGPASSRALKSFKTAHFGLPDDDRWDLETQRVLLGR